MDKIIINDEEWEVCPVEDSSWKNSRGLVILGYPRFVTLLVRAKADISTVQDLHDTRLELMEHAYKKGMSYEDYVKWKDIKSTNSAPKEGKA